MPTRKEYAGGAPATTLASGINNSTTSIPLTAGTGYPTGASFPFVICIDRGLSTEEKILCDSRSGNTITANASGRGYDGTSAVTHAAGASVEHVIDATTLTDLSAIAYDTTTDIHSQYILKSVADANSVLYATSDNTPAALAMGASTILARLAAGNIVAATPAEIRTLLALVVGTNVQAWDADLDDIAGIADVQGDIIIRGASGWQRLGAGTSGHVLKTQGAGANPQWAAETAGSSTDRATIGPWYGTVGGFSTASELKRVIGANPTVWVAPRAGSVTGISVASTVARTGGSASFEVYKNGVATGLAVVLNGTNTQYHYTTQAAGTDTFVAGDRLDVRATDSAFTAGGGQLSVDIEVTYS